MKMDKNKVLKAVKPYLFIAPFFIFFAIFLAYPSINGIIISMQRYRSIETTEFVGLGNYVKILSDEKFWIAIKNTVLLTVFVSILTIITLSLIIGVMLSSKRMNRFRDSVTTILFAPNVTSVVVIGIIFTYVLKTDGGIVNAMLAKIGLGPFRFLKDPEWALFSMGLLCTWRYLGINTLYVLSGLQNIPQDLYSAAKIDGCNSFNAFFRITLPLLKPTLEFIVFQAIVGSFAIFGEPFILVGSGGGAKYSMLYPNMYIYTKAFSDLRFGYSAALGFFLGLIILVVTIVQRRLMREEDAEGGKL